MGTVIILESPASRVMLLREGEVSDGRALIESGNAWKGVCAFPSSNQRAYPAI